jgi:histidinol-phosphate/aromatic aminotransferase/cobyric acid decarboxylase-like protein
MGGYGLPDSLRITVGLDDECATATDALMRFMAEGGGKNG